ncbi:MAG TPA: hypothetical protein ENI96_07290 [Sedimenticola thiotaurini]|uniref:Right handed beta helix domain-containing protein n=1 Tax=Sedimenticola thiotaurini TaxID=1543721 RepID=A0A831RKB1_9GAMM|nr:hypothetical protein [Sedimenticola thiotaurini]
MYRRLLRYLLVSGVIANLLAIATVAWVFLAIGESPWLLLEKAANRYAYQSYGLRRKLARITLDSGLVADWDAAPAAGPAPFPTLEEWRGQGASPTRLYSRQAYDRRGRPVGSQRTTSTSTGSGATIRVSGTRELLAAIRSARPGDTIEPEPGVYRLRGRSIPLVRGGTADAPVSIRARRLGDVRLDMETLEGFHVLSPYWVFENLDIRGTCSSDSRCEHAFHVVGRGRGFVLRNSRLADFNAPVKVNGTKVAGKQRYPDHGLIEYNSFVNSRPRDTGNPVTLLNIDNVNGWVVRGNLIADFSKKRSDRISYGAFMKGNGRDGVFERNLVICEMNLPADRGVRIGLSFGGGGTGGQFCRDGSCEREFTNGIMRNNVILNCSRDVGIYLNRAYQTGIFNNLIHNSLGIDVRFSSSTASIANNLISGRIRERDDGLALSANNLVYRGCFREIPILSGCPFERWFTAPAAADLSPTAEFPGPKLLGRGIDVEGLDDDFCGTARTPPIDMGPIQYSAGRVCNPAGPGEPAK